MKVSLNDTLPILLYYRAHNVFKSHVKSLRLTSCTLLYSYSSFSVLLQLTAALLQLTATDTDTDTESESESESESYVTATVLPNSSSNRFARTTHRKRTSRDRYPASPLARWPLPSSGLGTDPQKTRHVTATHCCVTQRKYCSSIVGRVYVAGVA
jgi:hypothetical protein